MELYFFRHGIAQDPSLSTPDHLRELTEEGVRELRHAAPMIKKLNLKLTHLYASPLVRAQQTAAILADTLGIEVEIKPEIGPGFRRAAVEKLVRDLDERSAVMFVGHEPDFSTTIGELTGGRVEIKKASLARVDVTGVNPLSGELVYLLPPKVFNKLG